MTPPEIEITFRVGSAALCLIAIGLFIAAWRVRK